MKRTEAVILTLPTRPWVPQWLGIVTMFVVILPIILLNGAYTGSMVEVSGTLGILSEDITMAYYATSVGMVVAYPLVPKIRAVVTPKTLLLTDLSLQAVISYFCGHATDIDFIIICSFFVGFLKAFVMLEFIIQIRPLFSPKNVRSEFYAYFYPIVFAGGQVSMALTAQLAYYYQWQYMYLFIVVLLLVAILFVLLFFRYAKRPIHIPFKEIDWRSMLLIAAALLFSIYLFTYGKTFDWFASGKLTVYALSIPLLLWLFFRRQHGGGGFYISTVPLLRVKSVVGYSFMMIVAFFGATSSLVTNYMNSIIRVDSIHANSLNLWLLPGFVVGAVLCFWWLRWQRWRFRFLISIGMFCYVFYLSLLYFGISPQSTYEMLYLPTFLRGLGMIIIYIAFGVYVVEDLDPKLMISNAFFLIAFRSVLAPVLSSSFFNNLMYVGQLRAMNVLSEGVAMDNPLAAQRYNQSLASALAQGHGTDEAAQVATNSLYSLLQTQSLLVSLKVLLGIVLVMALVMAVGSAFIPFHKTIKVKVVKTGDDMV
ncbi:MFS transporter [Bacteroides sp.]|uniref:MFS transporter n=1 Tax=Bacteroides sp. TaxID=29523 RepID=UPI002FC8DA98